MEREGGGCVAEREGEGWKEGGERGRGGCLAVGERWWKREGEIEGKRE